MGERERIVALDEELGADQLVDRVEQRRGGCVQDAGETGDGEGPTPRGRDGRDPPGGGRQAAEPALVLAEGSLRLPPLAEHPLGPAALGLGDEPAGHLPPVFPALLTAHFYERAVLDDLGPVVAGRRIDVIRNKVFVRLSSL